MCPAVGQGGREAGETRATRSSLNSSSHLSILRCACKGQPQTLNNNLHLVIGMEGQEKKNRNYWSMNCCHGDSMKYGCQWEFIAAAGKDDSEVVRVGRAIKNR